MYNITIRYFILISSWYYKHKILKIYLKYLLCLFEDIIGTKLEQ